MSLVLGIDPGPTSSGLVMYSPADEVVAWAESAASLSDVRQAMDSMSRGDLVLIERVESYGIPGNSLLDTAEVVGRLREYGEGRGLRVEVMTRREVCRQLDVTGGGKDRQVREVCLALHGRERSVAVGTKRQPGPLYGVSGHAWQALGLVLAWLRRDALDMVQGGEG